MTEPHADESIAAYALGALDLETAEQVHGHLASCPRCRGLTLRALHAACALPFSLPLYKAPADLKIRVLRAAQQGADVKAASAEAAVKGAALTAESTPPDSRLPRSPHATWRILSVVLPWVAAIVGWIVVVTVLIYSRGLSDRVRITKQNYEHEIAAYNRQVSEGATLRAYLTSPQLSILRLKNWVSATSNTRVDLIMRERSSPEIILADNLAPPPSGEVYVAWLKAADQSYRAIGTFTTSKRGEGMAMLNAALPLELFPILAISVEPTPVPRAPTSPLLFTVTLGGTTPVARPTFASTAATVRPAATTLPTSTASAPRSRHRISVTPAPTIDLPRIPRLLGASREQTGKPSTTG